MHIHREQRKSNEPRPRQRPKESPRLRILAPRRPLRMEPPVMQHNQKRQTTNHQPHPAHRRMPRKRTQHARRQHDEIRRDSSQQMPAGQAGDEGEIDE